MSYVQLEYRGWSSKMDKTQVAILTYWHASCALWTVSSLSGAYERNQCPPGPSLIQVIQGNYEIATVLGTLQILAVIANLIYISLDAKKIKGAEKCMLCSESFK